MSLTPTKNEGQSPIVSRETLAQLEAYSALLLKWNQKINLVGKTTESGIWTRHIDDSLQLLPLIPNTTKTLADLGSGAGLPGLVIAIARPEIRVTLIEQDQRKAAFLQEVVRALKLANTTTLARDITTVDARFDVITARALAPLSTLCAWAHPLLGMNAICLFPKGETFAKELEVAGDNWAFNHASFTSKTSGNSKIISISELSPKKGARNQP